MNKNNNSTPRENFLMSLLNKVIHEYKALLEFTRSNKPFKIVEITHISTIPGETEFAIQLTNKNFVVSLTAAEIMNKGYNLNDFNEFHAEMIRQAAQGKLAEFLKLSEKNSYKIVAKKFNAKKQESIFTIKTNEVTFTRTADELYKNKNLLVHMDSDDILDIGYTKGSESVFKTDTALRLIKGK